MPFTSCEGMPKGIRVHSWLTIERKRIIRQLPSDTRTKPILINTQKKYKGRIAPTPSGWLHLGHASTFSTAWDRARKADGTVVYRTEDLDPARGRPEYAAGAMEDLQWWGLDWDGEPVFQSERLPLFSDVLDRLIQSGHAYASPHSRKEIRAAEPSRSPIDGDPIFPPHLRVERLRSKTSDFSKDGSSSVNAQLIGELNFRFRVPDGRTITFNDNRTGEHSFVAGQDFGDFIVWKKDGFPAYELAVVVDDHEMGITEVVRGEDLLLSTARQILLYEALEWNPPGWYHCPLVIDPATNYRMSKTHRSLGLRELRARGLPPGKEPEYYFLTPMS